MPNSGALIGGVWTGATAGTIKVYDPATGEAFDEVSKCDATHAAAALEAAKAAGPAWEALGIDGRASHIESFKAKLLEHKDEIIGLDVRETVRASNKEIHRRCLLVFFLLRFIRLFGCGGSNGGIFGVGWS